MKKLLKYLQDFMIIFQKQELDMGTIESSWNEHKCHKNLETIFCHFSHIVEAIRLCYLGVPMFCTAFEDVAVDSVSVFIFDKPKSVILTTTSSPPAAESCMSTRMFWGFRSLWANFAWKKWNSILRSKFYFKIFNSLNFLCQMAAHTARINLQNVEGQN